MLNLVGVTSSAPAMAGAAAAAAAKAGNGDAGDSQFGEMLNELALDAAPPAANKLTGKASLSKGLSAVVPLVTSPLVAGVPPATGQVTTGVDAPSMGQFATEEPTKAVARRDDGPAESVTEAVPATSGTDNILAILINMTLPAITQDLQPVTSTGDFRPTTPKESVPLEVSKKDVPPTAAKGNASPFAPNGPTAAGTGSALAGPGDPSDLSVPPDNAALPTDAQDGTLVAQTDKDKNKDKAKTNAQAAKADTHTGTQTNAPSPTQGAVGVQGQPHVAAAHVNDMVADADASTVDDMVVPGVLANEGTANATAPVAASQQVGTRGSRPVSDAKRERLADGRQHQSKFVGGEPVPSAQVPGMTPAVSAAGDVAADARQRGDHSAAAKATPPVSTVAASSLEAAMRLTSDVAHTTSARTVGAAAPTSTSTEIGTLDSDVPRQIVQAIRMQWSQGVGTARVTLQPDYLGNLSIDIRVDHGTVTAVLDASNATVRHWLEGHEPLLRQALADQGLTLDRLVVNDEQTPSPTFGDEGQEHQEQPRQRRRPAAPDDATFEVVM